MKMVLLRKIFYRLGRAEKLKWMSDKTYLKILFFLHFGYKLDFKNLTTYNEKLQYLKTQEDCERLCNVVDKYEVRQYIKKKVGDKYLVPLLWVGKLVDDIPFDELPLRFVIKCTHDSGGVVVCNDKNTINIKRVKKFIKKRLKVNLFWAAREQVYKAIEPRIIIEKNLCSGKIYPKDYKFYVFNGVIDCVMVCIDREQGDTKFIYYDLNWNKLHYLKDEYTYDYSIEKPENFEEMINLVKVLAEDYKTARFDLYSVSGKIYFGEITFFNQGGFDLDISRETDQYWGEKIKINEGLL